MKLLAVLLLAGIAVLSSAVPVPSHDLSLESAADLEYLLFALDVEESDITDELKKNLREAYDKILERIKEAIEQGKEVKEKYLDKLKRIREKLKDVKADLDAKAKDLLKQIKEKAKDYWQKILDRLGVEKRAVEFHFEEVFADDDDDEPETELGKKMKEHLDKLLEKIKDAIEHGKTVKEETLEKLKEIREKLKEMKIDIGKHAKELFQKIREKVKDYFKKVLEKLGIQKRDVDMHFESMFMEAEDYGFLQKLKDRIEKYLDRVKELIEGGGEFEKILPQLRVLLDKVKKFKIDLGERIKEKLAEVIKKVKEHYEKYLENQKRAINTKDMLKIIKDMILANIDPEKVKEKVDQLFAKGSELADKLREKLREKGEKAKKKVLDWIDRLLDDKEKRSMKDTIEKIKNYFKDLGLNIKECAIKFGQWAKEKYEKGLEKGKNRIETLKKLAKEFISDAKQISKDVAEEAKEFFRDYKEDLGSVYKDLREKIDEILKRN